MAEFKKRGLDIKHKEKIDDWFAYLDQKEFGEKLENRIFEEINCYMSDKKTTDEILGELFEEPEWIIEIEEGLIEKYPELEATNIILAFA